MKEEIYNLLESDLLEKYLLGTTSDEETPRVEHFIDTSLEVRKAYIELQENLEQYSRSYATKAPEGLKEEILAQIQEPRAKSTVINWLSIAASAAAIFLGFTAWYYWDANNSLVNQQNEMMAEIDGLKSNLLQNDAQFAEMQSELEKLRNPETKKYVLRGNQNARNLKTVAYINPVEKLSLINIIDLPKLPEDKVFQMWADVDGKMVSLGILEKADNKLMSVPYKENASSYNITIEPKGGNDHATVENLVANIDFNIQEAIKIKQ